MSDLQPDDSYLPTQVFAAICKDRSYLGRGSLFTSREEAEREATFLDGWHWEGYHCGPHGVVVSDVVWRSVESGSVT